MKFSEHFIADCRQIWEAIGPDALALARDEGDTITNAGAWEFVLDANLLASYAMYDSVQELDTVLMANDYKDVLSYLAKECRLI
jgi:hypothetical protein